MPFAFLFELTFIALFFWVFLILLVVGTAFDRRGREEPKWYLIGVGFIAAAWYFWNDFTFFGPGVEGQVVLWSAIASPAFWVPVAWFLGLGLAYSVLEFGLTIRKSARGFAAAWQSFLSKTKTVPVFNADGSPALTKNGQGKEIPATQVLSYGEMILGAKTYGDTYRHYNEAVDMVAAFVQRPRDFSGTEDFFRQNQIIGAVLTDGDKLAVEPKVDKLELASHVSAWTFLWPAYAISLIIGDLLTEVFSAFADFLASISGRVVKAAFSDVFKV